jgi:hypothetical protein
MLLFVLGTQTSPQKLQLPYPFEAKDDNKAPRLIRFEIQNERELQLA